MYVRVLAQMRFSLLSIKPIKHGLTLFREPIVCYSARYEAGLAEKIMPHVTHSKHESCGPYHQDATF